jgi:uncharacterized protein YegJ (DUF2314 family)
MTRFALIMLAALCASCGGAGPESKPDTLISGGYDERAMSAAMERARGEVDTFIAALAAGNGSEFAVKVPIEDRGKVEHFWLVDIAYRDGRFEGQIGNDPGIVTNVKFGEARSVGRAEISDWMFMRDGKMHGNYTLRPLLEAMPEEEAERFRSMLANP